MDPDPAADAEAACAATASAAWAAAATAALTDESTFAFAAEAGWALALEPAEGEVDGVDDASADGATCAGAPVTGTGRVAPDTEGATTTAVGVADDAAVRAGESGCAAGPGEMEKVLPGAFSASDVTARAAALAAPEAAFAGAAGV